MRANNVRVLPASLLLSTVVLAAGCGVIPKREPTAIFEPTIARRAAPADWQQANWSLLVQKPVAGAMLDNDRIAVRPSQGEITVYKSAAWTDTAPDLVQSALLRRFEDSGRILSVARPGAGVRGDFHLQTELRDFQSVYVSAGRPEVRVEIYAKLVKSADGTVVAARAFRQTAEPATEDVSSVADAFGVALSRASDEIVGWTLASGNARK